jgi:S-DNA-T family DNA segregation ATPase FtsK/SpoIIIE
MSRLIFEARRRLPSPVARKGSITIEAPPELPRAIPPSLLKRALPVVIVLLIVGMVVAMVATGMRLISADPVLPVRVAAGGHRVFPR